MARNVERIGGQWVMTNLANRTITGGRVGLGRAAASGRPGGWGLGTLLGALGAFFAMENTADAAEYRPPVLTQIDPKLLGLTEDEINGLVDNLQAPGQVMPAPPAAK